MKKKIAILLFQFSIVVKGMERKLKEMGYEVESITKDSHDAGEYTEKYGLFFIFLPGDIMENDARQDNLKEMCSVFSEKKIKTIVLGEKKYHDDLLSLLPVLDSCWWLDRPFENEVLGQTVEKVINSDSAPAAKKRILIVDDDPSYAGMIKEWIKTDFRVDTVISGAEAVSFLKSNPVDLVLLDYEMPEINGPGVLRMLREDNDTKDLSVVFLTGINDPGMIESLVALKPAGHILKSATRDEILSNISGIIK